MDKLYFIVRLMMCADKNGDFNLVNYTYSSGVYQEQKAKDLYSRI